MLITCPECNHQVSDKAASCPSCGYPMRQRSKPKHQSQAKRMRLPNGFGRITKLTGKNLRKPYRAMVSDGKDSNGRPIGRLLKPEAYFSTYNEAYSALMAHHQNPYDFSNDITMQELYNRWTDSINDKVGISRKRQIKAAWDFCSLIKDTPVQRLRIRDVKNVLDNGTKPNRKGEPIRPTENSKLYIKAAISQMLDYAVEYEIIQHNFMKDVNLLSGSEVEVAHHISFTEEEMNIIKKNARNDEILEMILVNSYMGWRPGELVSIEVINVNMRDGYIIGGFKTKAGRNRRVPLHSGITAYISGKYNEALLSGRKYLFEIGEYSEAYKVYNRAFKKALKKYNLSEDHKPHDCRKQFVTMAKKSGVDEFAIKRIVGHSISDITENIYTDRDINWLKNEIEKIPF